jgi:hypothetical protein
MKSVRRLFNLPGASSRRAWGAVCLALYFALLLFASVPALHRLVHPDADSPDHHCVITLLVKGLVDTAGVASVVVVFFAFVIFRLPPPIRVVCRSFDYRLSPSRAPPQL